MAAVCRQLLWAIFVATWIAGCGAFEIPIVVRGWLYVLDPTAKLHALNPF